MIWRKHIHIVVLHLPDAWSNWNLEMLVFEERGKLEYPEKNLLEQGREQTTNSTHIWHQTWELNPPHWWEGSALTTIPRLLPSHIIIQFLKFKIPERVLLTEAICKLKGFQRLYASEDVRPVTPCSFHLLYKQFSSLVEGGKIYQKK